MEQDLKVEANNLCSKAQMIFHSLPADDPNSVRLFFDKIRDKLMDKILKGSFPFDSVVLRDRSRKIVLRDYNVAENEYFEKRYNRCC